MRNAYGAQHVPVPLIILSKSAQVNTAVCVGTLTAVTATNAWHLVTSDLLVVMCANAALIVANGAMLLLRPTYDPPLACW
jgi:hypothetical protein